MFPFSLRGITELTSAGRETVLFPSDLSTCGSAFSADAQAETPVCEKKSFKTPVLQRKRFSQRQLKLNARLQTPVPTTKCKPTLSISAIRSREPPVFNRYIKSHEVRKLQRQIGGLKQRGSDSSTNGFGSYRAMRFDGIPAARGSPI